MNTSAQNDAVIETDRKNICVKVFGVGGAGINVMELMLKDSLPGVSFVAVNTDAQSLAASSASEKVHLETQLLRGLGTGGDPDLGRALAVEQLPKFKSLCAGADVIFILAGLGGGAGTGISPVLACAAKEVKALVLGFVTTPFDCEGAHRQRLAQQGLAELKSAADGVISLPNQKVFKMIDENTSVRETFKITSEFLAAGVRGVWHLLMHKGLIDIHFADLAALLRDRHADSCFAVAEAIGPTRSREVIDKLLAHPMLDGGQMLADSEAVLVSLMGGADLTMAEVNRVMEQINRHCEHSQVIMGAAIDEAFNERLTVTLIAARKSVECGAAGQTCPTGDGEELVAQLLPRSTVPRPSSRFVPPAPALPPDQVQQLLARQGRGGSRSRKSSSQMRQGQLPLEIVSKGRFDKSEPTIHKGEDLDVPTYIRRGVALN
ncbi:MAG: cell division protein FtsZ [Verrucomicrobia bacterium]|nr:cell division protein FtsZ [Verrucomicrobiota bacterium]